MPSVLFDKNIPRGLRQHLTGCTVRTTEDEGWSSLSNGDLLSVAERAGFEVMLTADRRIRYQQNLAGRRLALIVLSSPAWPVVKDHIGDQGRGRCGNPGVIWGSRLTASGVAATAEGIAAEAVMAGS